MTKSKLKASGMIDQIKTEIKIMYSLQHEHIIKLFNHFEDDEHIYLIIEYASGVINLRYYYRYKISPFL